MRGCAPKVSIPLEGKVPSGAIPSFCNEHSMTRKYFGTDGIRGLVGEAPITPDFMVRLGYAAGEVLVRRAQLSPGLRPAVLIGKDTRISGYMLEASLEAGFAAAGVDVMRSEERRVGKEGRYRW